MGIASASTEDVFYYYDMATKEIVIETSTGSNNYETYPQSATDHVVGIRFMSQYLFDLDDGLEAMLVYDDPALPNPARHKATLVNIEDMDNPVMAWPNALVLDETKIAEGSGPAYLEMHYNDSNGVFHADVYALPGHSNAPVREQMDSMRNAIAVLRDSLGLVTAMIQDLTLELDACCAVNGAVEGAAGESSLGKAYPNPTTGPLSIPFQVDGNQGTIEIFDVYGSILATWQVLPQHHLVQFDVSNLSSGFYGYRLTVDGALIGTGKFVAINP